MNFSKWLITEANEEQSFIQAIKQNPRDYGNWLAYSDYLDEHNDSRALLINVLVQLTTNKSSKKYNNSMLLQADQVWKTVDNNFKQLLAGGFPIALRTVQFTNRRNNPGLSTIVEILRLTKNVQSVTIEAILSGISNLLHGFGVETIDARDGHPVAMYVNMGEMYEMTVLYDLVKGQFMFVDLGTWLERNSRRYRIE